ncbi:MAG: type I restriction-modification enzyme R subunit C-terminal domain-containing protein, partial [Actinomycetes bacterium]
GAAKEAFARFLDDTKFNANQIEFINLIVDELANKGIIAASRFYESPFTDISAIGPDGLFTSAQVDEMVSIINDVKANAAA